MRTLLLCLTLIAAGCQKDEELPPPQKLPQGRAETQSIRNTEAVGYQGGQIADKVDAALDANDARKQRTEEQTAD